MNKTNITFVLGAGASAEVSMPVGTKLMENIQRLVDLNVDIAGSVQGADNDFPQALQALVLDTNAHPQKVYESAKHTQSGLNQAPSIDNFIDCQKENDLVAKIGKLAITSSILTAERESDLYRQILAGHLDNPIIDLGQDNIKNSWYNSFFKLLTERKTKETVIKNLQDVRVISFNYDRTLEHFLHSSFQNFYKISPEEATEIISKLDIFHPYGTVGELPWMGGAETSDYGEKLSPNRLVQISKRIKTFTEGTDLSNNNISIVRETVLQARTVIFLGFAFHPINLDLLYPKRPTEVNYEQTIYGSALGMSEENTNAIMFDLATKTGILPQNVRLRNELTASQLFNSYSRAFQIK